MAESSENRSLKDVQKRISKSKKKAVTVLSITVAVVFALIVVAVIICQMNTGELFI